MESRDVSPRAVRRGLPRTGRAVPEPPEETPFLRPRSRTRVRRVRRGWAAHVLLVLEVVATALLSVALLWGTYAAVRDSPHLRVRRVEVHGNHFLSTDDIRELLGPAAGANILWVDIRELQERLQASPWLEHAAVHRSLPDTLQISVQERQPVALAELDRLHLMDARGDLIAMYGVRTSNYDLPVLRGLAGLTTERRRVRAQAVAALLDDLGELEAEISEIAVGAGDELTVVLRGAGEVLELGAPPYREAFETFLRLRHDLHERAPGAQYFDLRFHNRIYAKGSQAVPARVASR